MTQESDQQDLEASISAFGEAWARGDYEMLQNILSRSYTHTDVKGRFQDRGAWLEYARGRSGATNQIDFADVTTRLVGDVAVITGRNDIEGSGIVSGDSRAAISLRFTQVWVRTDGRWLREAFQATIISR